MTDRTKDEAESSTTPPAKKEYRAPVLIQWGTLRDITRAAGNTSPHLDGAPNKTALKRTH